MFTIKKLRQSGYKVRVLHKRNKTHIMNVNHVDANTTIVIPYKTLVSPRGGETNIEITTPDGEISVFGVAHCSPSDNFCRNIGNEIALGRAVEQLKEMGVSV